MDYKRKKEYGIEDNKLIEFKDIKGIYIENFRLFKDEQINLGKNITIFSGRNGSMKSTLMALIAHIYRTEYNDIYDKKMESQLRQLFRLSMEKDTDTYKYNIQFEDINSNKISEPVEIYPDKKENRHRIVPSGHADGDGFFSLQSVYMNMMRLIPLIHFTKIENDNNVQYTAAEDRFISSFYEKILLRTEFNQHEAYNAKKGNMVKPSIGPKGANYDVDALSSGEDNLSQIVNVLISFMRIHNVINNKNKLTGILTIDEFDSSLHPIAQLNLYNFLLGWSKKYNVKILLSTHSLYLLKEIIIDKKRIESGEVIINFIANGYKPNSILSILENPSYDIALSELTLKDVESERVIKLNVLVEDEIAKHGLERILSEKRITDRLEIRYQYNNAHDGVNWPSLKAFANNFTQILEESRSIIIFDQDVTNPNIKDFTDYLILPSLTQATVPFEQELVLFILTIDSNDEFFKKTSTRQEALKQELTESNVPLNLNDLAGSNYIKYIKNWFNKNKGRNKKLITYMIKHKDNAKIYNEFKNEFIILSNKILRKHGLPKL